MTEFSSLSIDGIAWVNLRISRRVFRRWTILHLRVLIDRGRWLALAPGFWEEANQRLRANGLPAAKFLKNPSKPVPVHASLGKGALRAVLGC